MTYRKIFTQKTLITSLALSILSGQVYAKVTAEQAAQLGNNLTPLGAEKAANQDGSIPSWTGGVTKAPAGYSKGDHHPIPFQTQSPLFTIDINNYQNNELPKLKELESLIKDLNNIIKESKEYSKIKK